MTGPVTDRTRSPRQEQGASGERRARSFLIGQGLEPIGQNLSSPLGEIDLLMLDRGQWVFVEVRQRRSMAFGGAAASISYAKQQKLKRQSQRILQDHFGSRAWPPVRFDVIAIEGDPEGGKIDWIQNAF